MCTSVVGQGGTVEFCPEWAPYTCTEVTLEWKLCEERIDGGDSVKDKKKTQIKYVPVEP